MLKFEKAVMELKNRVLGVFTTCVFNFRSIFDVDSTANSSLLKRSALKGRYFYHADISKQEIKTPTYLMQSVRTSHQWYISHNYQSLVRWSAYTSSVCTCLMIVQCVIVFEYSSVECICIERTEWFLIIYLHIVIFVCA